MPKHKVSSPPFTVQVQPAPVLSASFQVTAAQAGNNLPFTIGHAFRKGEIPAGSSAIGNIPELQVVPKNAWPDGSVKFAIVSGLTSFTAAGPKTIGLGIGQASTAVALSLADLKATGISAAIGAGNFGSAAWSGTDWDAPFMEWIRGPFMSSWIYRKPVGSDAHLVGWLEVRLYKGGAVEVLPWIENGYLTVAAPTNKNATYSFTLGGTQRFSAAFDLLNHTRTVLVSGTALSHWLGSDPKLTPTHDKAYLQAARLVPAYRGQLSSTATFWSSLAQTYTPLQQGNYPAGMGTAGYHGSIGLLPEWDAAYLASSDLRAYAGVIVNAYSAGRYGIHFRDERTQRPLRFSSYPNLVLDGSSGLAGTGASSKNTYTPTATGTTPPTWNSTHHPSVGFMAYLLTGRFYFMEEVQFAATVHYLKNTDTQRQFSAGVLLSNAGANTTRGAAWATRTLAQAACITPDSDTALRGEFLASLESNVNFYHGRYVAMANNPLGFVQPYSDYTTNGDGKYFEAAWMQDFFTASYGYALDMDLPLSATGKTRMREFFAWKARSIIGRLGGTAPTEYLYRDAAVYTVAIAPSDTPDYTGGTGPWFADWGQAYTATTGSPNSGIAGDLRGGYFPDATSYWGNLQPAIAYAVEHSVPGALDAYRRMTGAANWPLLVSSMNTQPVWSVRPRNA
ncbi:hypothetical protein [Noviherbaspirillum denitrificans]|uniref:Uncharacterized protein n=1 Tax=Noviherbaspirillum denitrificans TaxID=1968433 RepID=A0A254THX1_9BURK|nr:hypothetical protein [Noviherbaspirillum denitrificans]OWW22240.1 hypothetical protein AYR66_24810 [Noviherbaspirillum denitrificans]